MLLGSLTSIEKNKANFSSGLLVQKSMQISYLLIAQSCKCCNAAEKRRIGTMECT